MASFLNKLKLKWNEGKFVCIGLDCAVGKLPQDLNQFNFNKQIIDQTAKLVCAYKINSAFYEAEGLAGWQALEQTISYLRQTYPDIATILDAKRGDTDNTNQAYTKSIFDNLGFDAVTVNPYLGQEALEPFLKYQDKGIIILVKTSNPGAGEFQDLEVNGKPLYQIVVGSQNGDLLKTLINGLDSNKQGLIISSSRAIIFAQDPRQACEDLHLQIQKVLQNV
ncbi:orotidine-5'-phosphate decarboxylase [Candidatus Daviesbacteria bacterium]|nr:orotidine-5'-phosphate decarboxylase [Candidatus Daviesbacteria bacterium]